MRDGETDNSHLAACGDQSSHPDRHCHFPRLRRFRSAQLRDYRDLPSPGGALASARALGLGIGGWHPRPAGIVASYAAPTGARVGSDRLAPGDETKRGFFEEPAGGKMSPKASAAKGVTLGRYRRAQLQSPLQGLTISPSELNTYPAESSSNLLQ
jgi:hypothetical protein